MGVKVLLIRLSSLGDTVLATSAVEALHRDRPTAVIDVLTKPAFAEVFAGNPAIREVRVWGAEDSPLEVAAKLRPERYDLIADLHGNLRTRALRLVLGGRWRVYAKGAFARRAAVFFRARKLIEKAPHVTNRYAAALAELGVQNPAPPKIYLDLAHVEKARALLAGAGWDGAAKIAALAPGAAWPTKAWPADKWHKLAGLLADAGAFPLLVGGRGEEDLCAGVLGGLKGLNAAGATTIRETAALLAQASVLVTNDSAPLHIAEAVATPVVALFGPTVADFGFYPLGPRDVLVERDEPCRPCALHGGPKCPLGHFKCLKFIATEEVAEKALALLGGDR